MKYVIKIIALVLCSVFIFVGCAVNIPVKKATNTGSENDIALEETQTEATIPTGNLSSETDHFEPVTWQESYYGDGMLQITITSARVVKDTEEINLNGFMDDTSVIIYHGEWYDEYCKDWRTYADQYMTVYQRYDFCDDSGNFVDGVSMVLLDVTVENLDATNRYQAEDGSWTSRLGNPYVFNVQFIGKLLDLNQKNESSQTYNYYLPNYYSEYNSCPEMSSGFEVAPGERVSFQLGFLVGNNEDGSEIDLSKLAISRSATLDYMWFELKLKEVYDE